MHHFYLSISLFHTNFTLFQLLLRMHNEVNAIEKKNTKSPTQAKRFPIGYYIGTQHGLLPC